MRTHGHGIGGTGVGYDCSFTSGLQVIERRNGETPVSVSCNLCFLDNWIKYNHLFRSLLSWLTSNLKWVCFGRTLWLLVCRLAKQREAAWSICYHTAGTWFLQRSAWIHCPLSPVSRLSQDALDACFCQDLLTFELTSYLGVHFSRCCMGLLVFHVAWNRNMWHFCSFCPLPVTEDCCTSGCNICIQFVFTQDFIWLLWKEEIVTFYMVSLIQTLNFFTPLKQIHDVLSNILLWRSELYS